MAKQLYDYWFVQFDFPDEIGRPYKSSGGEMVWNEKLKREVPACFDVMNLGNLCSFRNGINYTKDEVGSGYQIVNVRNISSSNILLDGEDFDTITVPMAKAENYILNSRDIIIARSGCPGSARLLLSPTNTLFCGFIICCSANDSGMRNYLTYCLKQLEGTKATTSGGSILQNVSQDTLKGLHIVVPTELIVKRFNEIIDLTFARMLNCLIENKTLTKQRDELLPLLMNGQASLNYHLSEWHIGFYVLICTWSMTRARHSAFCSEPFSINVKQFCHCFWAAQMVSSLYSTCMSSSLHSAMKVRNSAVLFCAGKEIFPYM